MDAPFHAGERAVQTRAGVRERMAELGPRVIRDAMPAQHRAFFPLLPFIVLGAVDAGGQPWATLLVGEPGFVQSHDDTTLRIAARPLPDDPLAALIVPGADLGMLGIELPTRRRNRANGLVTQVDANGFTVHVQQSFGNCPKYIQQREPLDGGPAASRPGAPRRSDRLDREMAGLVRRADTFFIASHVAAGGSDVSHRGGRAGFLQLATDGRTLSWPDFIGNSFYNTLGNLHLEPRAGLVLPDFETGDLLHIAGRVDIVWDGPEVVAVPGAQRLLRLHVEQALLRPAALPLRWRLTEWSSFLP